MTLPVHGYGFSGWPDQPGQGTSATELYATIALAAAEGKARATAPRLQRYDQKYDRASMKFMLREYSPPEEPKRLSAASVVVRRIYDLEGMYTHTVIDIMSRALCEVLKEVNDDVEGIADFTKYPAETTVEELYHSRLGLEARLKSLSAEASLNTELISDIQTVFQLLDEDIKPRMENFERLMQTEEITYDLLWMLFVPNTPVYHYHQSTEQHKILEGRSLKYFTDPQGNKFAELNCRIITADGRTIGYGMEKLSITHFDGVCKMSELEAFPLRYYNKREEVQAAAVKRGKQYAALGEISHHGISGRAMRYSSNGRYEFWASGRVLLDPLNFNLNVANRNLAALDNIEVKKSLNLSNMTDDLYMLCNPIVFGFNFGTKTWGGFAMDRLKHIVHVKEPFEQLVLGQQQKALVRALVRQHHSRASVFDDIIAGKGRGLIGLLAGPPGSGKTLTAEAVAELTQKPLYSISASELTGGAADVDDKLQNILGLAKKWDAVLLLDEAEVFLQQRTVVDIKRNKLVGVFLRQLEYYEGIMIMTTNLIGHIDEAFESRIHFCINYPELSLDSRLSIWKMFFQRASANISDADIHALAQRDLNGRQIKNAVISAQSIAMDEGDALSLSHVHTVMSVFNDWTEARQKQK